MARPKARFWPYIVIWGIIIYVVIDVLLAFLRPDYSLVHNAESDYGRGRWFWLMDLNFLLRCGFSLALVGSLWQKFSGRPDIKKASYWLFVWAIASGLLAFFADNPEGYPKLWSGSIHLALAAIAFIAVAGGMLRLSRLLEREPGWGEAGATLTVNSVLAIIALLLTAHSGFRPHALGGLYERIFLALVFIWQLILASELISRHPKKLA